MRRIFKGYTIFCLVTVCFVLQTIMLSAKVKYLNFSSSGDDIVLNNFHITKVVDKREDTNTIGYMTTGASASFLTANFKNGLTSAFNEFLIKHVKQYATSSEVELHVLKYNLFEKTSFKGAEIGLTTHFALYNHDNQKIFDYVITDTRNTGMNMSAFAAELLRRNLTKFIAESEKYLPEIFKRYNENAQIVVSYFIDRSPEERNLVAYNPIKPLNVYNFNASPPANPQSGSASESGISLEYQIREQNGNPEVYIKILNYFDGSKSWMLRSGDANQLLRLEQIKFKISAYFTNELMKELKVKTFTLPTIKDEIAFLINKYNKQIKDYQAAFDNACQKGSTSESLDDWNRKISFYDSYTVNQ